MPIIWVERLQLEGGLELNLKPDSIVVFVGTNNSGKSAALRAIRALLKVHGPDLKAAIRGLDIKREIEADELRERLLPYRTSSSPGWYQAPDGNFHESHVPGYWNGAGIGELASIMVSMLLTDTRLSDTIPPSNINLQESVPNHPFQRMIFDRSMENQISSSVRKAFASDFVLDRFAGNVVPAYIGNRPELAPGEERGDLSYITRVRALGRLQDQGDGVRSFVSLIARVLTEARPIILIDEPEAFLHPPQARLIGRELAVTNRDRQTFIATHSSDVLQGLLSGQQQSRVSVVRLSRSEGGAPAVSLAPQQIELLWKDPILRFSNILDGLFHSGVIITESDADCRFYEALIGLAAGEDRSDLHFVYSGGKDRMHVIVKALADLGMPVAVVVDFDMLNDEHVLRRLVEAAGGVWTKVESDWKAVKTGVESKSRYLGASEFLREVRAQLARCSPSEAVPRDVLSKVRALTRQASPWDHCKMSGLAAIPPGESAQAAVRLLATLRHLGVFVVPVGEMEAFKRTIGGHGPRWVEEAMKCDLQTDPELATARDFAQEIYRYFA